MGSDKPAQTPLLEMVCGAGHNLRGCNHVLLITQPAPYSTPRSLYSETYGLRLSCLLYVTLTTVGVNVLLYGRGVKS